MSLFCIVCEIASYWSKTRRFSIPHLHLVSPLGATPLEFAEIFGIRKQKDCPSMWYKNIAGTFFGLVTKYACDRQTDGQNYDSQDRASIAASRGKSKNTHKTYDTIISISMSGLRRGINAINIFTTFDFRNIYLCLDC